VPPHADPALEQRILKAARRLWIRGGEHALTMREVAKAARTTTPTVYERFRSRRKILEALCIATRQKLFARMQGSNSAFEACSRYVEFAQDHPHEFELLSAGWSKPPSAGEQWPSFTLLKKSLADRYGGRPDAYTRPALAIWSLAHGTAMLIVVGKTSKQLQAEMRLACLEAVAAIERTLGEA
jgi:AcrR family transcriptional regulator